MVESIVAPTIARACRLWLGLKNDKVFRNNRCLRATGRCDGAFRE